MMTGPATTDITPLVSVIMPFLNAERFLEEAIKSVFGQTYHNWVLLLVDDGSTDASTQIARRFARDNPEKVRYLEHAGHKNLGASAARNLGIRNASGSYIAFLDSDDVWLPEKLERQMAVLKAHPRAGMIIGASHYWYGWTGKPEDAARDVVKPVGAPQDTLVEPPLLSTLLYPLGRGAAPSLNSLLIRAALVEQVRGWEDQFKYFYTDQVFLSKLYLRVPIYIESACSDRYRQHSSSSMARAAKAGDHHRIRRRFLEWFEMHLAEEGLNDPRVLDALRAARWPYRHPVAFHLQQLRRRSVWHMRRRLALFLHGVLPDFALAWLRRWRAAR